MERRDTLPLRRARVHESREHDEIDATADARFVDGGPPKSKKSMGLSQRFRFLRIQLGCAGAGAGWPRSAGWRERRDATRESRVRPEWRVLATTPDHPLNDPLLPLYNV